MPRRFLPATLAACCVLAACQVPPVPSGGSADAPRRPRASGTASPAPSASAPSDAPGGASPSPGPAAGAAVLLQRPPGAVRTLVGKVKLDAGYVVGAGAGGIVTAGGAEVLGAGGGALVQDAAGPRLQRADGTVLATGAGNIVSNNGGSIISNNGGSLISDKGAGILSNNGGGLIGNNGGGLIGNNGGGIIGNKGGGYRVTQAAPVAGEVLAAAGVAIAVRSMRTGAYVPLGVDAAGAPVHVVYTNLAGGFELYVPEAEAGNVIVEAAVAPGVADPRLGYRLVSGVAADVDEDSAVVTDLLRRSFAERLAEFFAMGDRAEAVESVVDVDRTPPEAVPVLRESFGALWDAANASGLVREPDRELRLAYAYAVTDACLRDLDLGGVALDPASGWSGTAEPAVPAIMRAITRAREAAGEQLRRDPAAFSAAPWFQALNERLVAVGRRAAPAEIRRPSDLSRLMMEEYLLYDPRGTMSFEPPVTRPEECGTGSTVCNSALLGLESLYQRLGVADGRREVERLAFAQQAVIIATVLNFAFTMPPEGREEVFGIVRRYPPAR